MEQTMTKEQKQMNNFQTFMLGIAVINFAKMLYILVIQPMMVQYFHEQVNYSMPIVNEPIVENLYFYPGLTLKECA